MRDMLCKIRQYLTSGHQPFCHIVNYLLITFRLSPCCIWLETVGQNHQWYTSTTMIFKEKKKRLLTVWLITLNVQHSPKIGRTKSVLGQLLSLRGYLEIKMDKSIKVLITTCTISVIDSTETSYQIFNPRPHKY